MPGVWGPYYSAMIPGLWLNEGGQSATGALIDHVIDSHSRGAELCQVAEASGLTVFPRSLRVIFTFCPTTTETARHALTPHSAAC